MYKNLTSSRRKFCWSTENKTARMKFWSWHRRFGHLSILTPFKGKTSLKQLVIDWQFFSFDHRTLEWQAGRGGGRGQDATSQMYPFLSKRNKPVSTGSLFDNEVPSTPPPDLRGASDFSSSSDAFERYEGLYYCCPILGWTQLRWSLR